MKLRPYQEQIVDAIFREWEAGNRSTIAVAATGLGKTLIFAAVIQRIQPKRVMVLAHRQELIWQAKDKIAKVTGLRADVEMGEHRSSLQAGLFHPQAQVIVSTVQTHCAGGDGGGRMTKFDPNDFGLLIIDECHKGVSPSYKRVVEYYSQNPDLKILGTTATPDRSDEEALGQIFDSVAFEYEVLDAIHDGWLVPIEQQMVSIESLDYSKIRTTAGDLNGADLAAVMESEKNLHGVASSTIDIIGNRKGIGFSSSVNHARILSDIFNRHRSGMSSWVSGTTDKEERKMIIRDFAEGKIQWLWNCGVFTEGFDDSGIEVISMARPTKSRSLYAQMCGRAFRPHESIAHSLGLCPAAAVRRQLINRSVKPSALVIDFVGNSGRHKLMTTADILGGKVSDAAIQAAVSEAIKNGRPVRMDKSVEEEEKEIEKRKQRELEAQAKKAHLIAKATYRTQKVDAFDILDIRPNKPSGWDKGKTLSDKMRGLLKRSGFNPDTMDYTQAKQLCGVLIDRWNKGLCSIKQAGILKKYGSNPNVSFDDAKAMIDRIAANGWKPLPKVKIPSRKSQFSDVVADFSNPFE